MLVTTTENIPGQEYEILGECFGVVTQSRDVISNIGASFKNIIGGEIKGYTKLLATARQDAIDRLKLEAQNMGADAVVMMRFDSGSLADDMLTVVAYGTAVKFKEPEPRD